MLYRTPTNMLLLGCTTLFGILGSVCQAQVVQQPSFRTFSYTGGAWVPDQGTASLGGSTYSRTGSTSRGWGPYAPRAAGGSLGGSSLSASVTIIDLDALDQAMLNAPLPQGSTVTDASSTQQPGTSGQSTAQAARRRLAGARKTIVSTTSKYSVDKGIVADDHTAYMRAIKGHNPPLQKAAIPSQIEEDVRYYIQQGQQAEAANRLIAARVYYRMAFEAMPPELVARYKKIMDLRAKEAAEKRKAANQPSSIRF